MPPTKPKYQPKGRFRLPTPKPIQQLSLFDEYPYVFFVALFAIVTLLAKSAGMSLWDATIIGAWAGSIAFFSWQLFRYLKYRANPEAAAKEEAARKALLTANGKAPTNASDHPAPKVTNAPKPKIAVVPRRPSQRVLIRKPGMNVKPQPETDQTPKT
jgi:hypothetical protein